jgi:hypothetical protein
LFESIKEIFERPKKLVCTKQVDQSFCIQLLFGFGLFESILDEPKTMDHHQNLMLFPNIGSEMVCLFLFQRSRGIFAKHKIDLGGEQTGFFKTCIIPLGGCPTLSELMIL